MGYEEHRHRMTLSSLKDSEKHATPYQNEGEAVNRSETDTDNQVDTIQWPRQAAPKSELSDDEIEVINTAVNKPHIHEIIQLFNTCEFTEPRKPLFVKKTLKENWPHKANNMTQKEIESTPNTTEETPELTMETTLKESDTTTKQKTKEQTSTEQTHTSPESTTPIQDMYQNKPNKEYIPIRNFIPNATTTPKNTTHTKTNPPQKNADTQHHEPYPGMTPKHTTNTASTRKLFISALTLSLTLKYLLDKLR